MAEHEEPAKQSLLPYDTWAAEALRHVVEEALDHVAHHGLPGGHHFYLTFLTGHPGVEIPARLKTRFPDEMTIVLQHQFWDLAVDRAAKRFSIGLSFGGVPATLVVPFAALTAFADPEVRFGLRFAAPSADEPGARPAAEPSADKDAQAAAEPAETPQVVSLDAFRQRGAPRE